MLRRFFRIARSLSSALYLCLSLALCPFTASAGSVDCHLLLELPTGFDVVLTELAGLIIGADMAKVNGLLYEGLLRERSEEKRGQLKEIFLAQTNLKEADFEVLLADRIERLQARTNIQTDSTRQQNEFISQQSYKMNPARYGRFYPIEAAVGGRIWKGDGVAPIFVEKPYLIMDAPISQYIWQKVVELAEINLAPAGRDKIPMNPSSFKGRDDNPVESLKSVTATQWLQALNALSELNNPEITEQLGAIFDDHQPGDTYRLPSQDELAHLIELLFSFESWNDELRGAELAQLQRYGWFDDSGELRSTAEIGTKQPATLPNGAIFWDVIGNVDQMTMSYVNHQSYPNSIWTLGGSHQSSKILKTMASNEKSNVIGFRIIRHRKPAH